MRHRNHCGKVTGNIGDQTYTYNTDPKTTGSFTVDVKTSSYYNTNVIALYGRKAIYIKEDGTYVLGGWEKGEVLGRKLV